MKLKDIEIFCGECGEVLDAATFVFKGTEGIIICKECWEKMHR